MTETTVTETTVTETTVTDTEIETTVTETTVTETEIETTVSETTVTDTEIETTVTGGSTGPGITATGPETTTTGTPTVTTSANPTSNVLGATPTFTAQARVRRDFASIYDTAAVPDGQAIFSLLTTVNTNTDEDVSIEYVVQYLGSYLVRRINGLKANVFKDPFADVNPTFGDEADQQASGSASGCAAVCAFRGFKLSVNSAGSCLCGNEINFEALTVASREDIDEPCRDIGDEFCGGGPSVSDPNGDSYVAIIIAVPSDSDIVVVTPAGQTILPSK